MSAVRLAAVSVLSVLASVSAWAQPAPAELFVPIPGAEVASRTQSARIEQAVVERYTVGMRLDRLFEEAGVAAARVQLHVADWRWIARFERLDRDSSGFRSWVGALEGIEFSHVVFTERNGIVSGLINAVSMTYQIRTISPGIYALEKFDLPETAVELDPALAPEEPVTPPAMAVAAQDAASTVDVLLLYTPAARAAAGGTAQIQAIASQVISDSNTIYGRSGIVPRLRLAGTHELALTEAASMRTDLTTLTDSTVVRGLRDLARADLVQLLVSSPDLSACGIAWLLRSLASTNFDAYSVADITCLGQYSPTHEMGHNMGSHHAPEDGGTGALFPYSYGFKDPVRGFRTVMAYPCVGVSCPRIPNFSNPLLSHNGGATGTLIQDNALSINNAAFTVANFRQASDPTPPALPSAPTGVRSSVVGTTVVLSWDSSLADTPSVTAYTLQVGSASGKSDLFNTSVGYTTSVSGNVPPGFYFWRVVATNPAGASPPSSESQVVVGLNCLAPAPPQDFTFSISGRVVTLAWKPAASGGVPTTYVIDAGSASGLTDLYSGPTGNANLIAVAEAPPGAYFVRIRAHNSCGTSGASNEQFIIVQ